MNNNYINIIIIIYRHVTQLNRVQSEKIVISAVNKIHLKSATILHVIDIGVEKSWH